MPRGVNVTKALAKDNVRGHRIKTHCRPNNMRLHSRFPNKMADGEQQ